MTNGKNERPFTYPVLTAIFLFLLAACIAVPAWAVEQTGENPIAVALALCYCGHDPDWEHQEWLDTATIESPPPLAGKLQDTPISRCAQTRCQGEEE